MQLFKLHRKFERLMLMMVLTEKQSLSSIWCLVLSLPLSNVSNDSRLKIGIWKEKWEYSSFLYHFFFIVILCVGGFTGREGQNVIWAMKCITFICVCVIKCEWFVSPRIVHAHSPASVVFLLLYFIWIILYSTCKKNKYRESTNRRLLIYG